MTRFLFVQYEGQLEGMRHRARLGSMAVRDGRWQVRCWGSGIVIGGSLRRAEVVISARPFRRTTMDIDSHDGGYRGSVTVVAQSERVARRLSSARTAASKADARRALVREGQWWADPMAFLELGPTSAVSVTDARYVSGWHGPIRFETHPGRGILDLDASGITLRGFRRHLHIGWRDVRGIAIDGAGGDRTGEAAVLRIKTEDGEVRFESHRAAAADLRRRLAPLTRRIERAAASGSRSREDPLVQ